MGAKHDFSIKCNYVEKWHINALHIFIATTCCQFEQKANANEYRMAPMLATASTLIFKKIIIMLNIQAQCKCKNNIARGHSSLPAHQDKFLWTPNCLLGSSKCEKSSPKNKSVWTLFKCTIFMETQMRFKNGDVPTKLLIHLYLSSVLPCIDYWIWYQILYHPSQL